MKPHSNYTSLTTHTAARPTRKPRAIAITPHMVPEIGTSLTLDVAYLVQDVKGGVKGTPMVKIRFIDGEWKLVARNQAGMYVFLNQDVEDTHTKFVIESLIPNKTAAYARLE